MKRFLSMMLTVMLILSSFVMVSADDTFSVIKVDSTYEYDFGTTYTGIYEVSADVYVTADVTKASISAADVETAIDVEKAGEWQTVNVGIYNASFSKVAFKAEGGAMYVNNIKVGTVNGTKTLVYSENFEGYEVGDAVNAVNNSKYVATSSDYLKTTNPMTEFNVVDGIEGNDTKVGNIFHPNYTYAHSSGIPTYRTNDEGEKDETAYRIVDNGEKPILGEEYYNIDLPAEAKSADHLVVEFDVYNAANAWNYRLSDPTDQVDPDNPLYSLLIGEDGKVYAKDWRNWVMDQLWFSVAESSRGLNNLPGNELPTAKLEGDTYIIQGRTEGGADGKVTISHNGNVQTWNKVRYEVKKEQWNSTKWHVETKLTYGGVTTTNHTYSAAMSDMGKLIFSVDRSAGGRFYIDNLNVYRIDDIDDSAYVTRFAEDFEDMEVDSAVTGFDFADPHDDGKTYTTFTVKENVNGNATKSGRLYNNAANRSDISRLLEDGSADEYAVLTANSNGGYGNMEWFTVDLPGKYGKLCWNNDTNDTQTVRKLRLQFKYYLPSSISYPSEVKDNIQLGFTAEGMNDLMHVANGKTNITPVLIEPWTQKTYFNVAAGRDLASHSSNARNWIPVTVDFETKLNEPAANQRFTTTIKYNGAVNCTRTHERSMDLNKFYLGLNYTTGGIAYIDDIVISTPFEAADFNSINNRNVENVYTAGTEIAFDGEGYNVSGATFGTDESIVLNKGINATVGNIKVITAIFNGDVLEEAKINDVNATEFSDFSSTVVPLTNKLENIPADLTGYNFKVFLFDSEAGLKPLADMLVK